MTEPSCSGFGIAAARMGSSGDAPRRLRAAGRRRRCRCRALDAPRRRTRRSVRGPCTGPRWAPLSLVLLDGIQLEVLGQPVQGEFLAQFAGAVLVGEHALDPERVGLGDGDVPPDCDGVFGVVVTVSGASRAVLVGRGEVLVGEPYPLAVEEDFGLVESGRGAKDFADRHVSVLGDVDVDAGSDGQIVERSGGTGPSAGGDEAVAEAV